MKKIIVLPEYMDCAQNHIDTEEMIPIQIGFTHIFEDFKDVVCEYYVYNIDPSKVAHECFYNCDNISYDPNDTDFSTIHKFVFYPDGKVAFESTGHADIISAISSLREEEIKNSVFCMDVWCDNHVNNNDTRTPRGGLATTEALEKILSKATKNILFYTRCWSDDADDFYKVLDKKYSNGRGNLCIYRPYRAAGCFCHNSMFKKAREIQEKGLDIDKSNN